MTPAETKRWNLEFDRLLEATGIVSKERFDLFAYAYSYEASTSMQWVEAKLQILRSRLGNGRSLTLYCPALRKSIEVTSSEALVRWAAKHFPGAQLT